mgnify:CR=1 FL=1
MEGPGIIVEDQRKEVAIPGPHWQPVGQDVGDGSLDVGPLLEHAAAISGGLGVPREMGSCHTAVVGDYVVEGHVPAADIRRLLEEAPDAAGLAVPGMPIGSPGMEQGDYVQPYDVMLLARDGGEHTVFSSHE